MFSWKGRRKGNLAFMIVLGNMLLHHLVLDGVAFPILPRRKLNLKRLCDFPKVTQQMVWSGSV